MNLRAAVDLHLLGLQAVHDEGTAGLGKLLSHLRHVLNAERLGLLSGNEEPSRQANMLGTQGPTPVPALPEGMFDHGELAALYVEIDREGTGHDLILPLRSTPDGRADAHLLVRLKAGKMAERGTRPARSTLTEVSRLLAEILAHRAEHHKLHETATRDALTGLFTRSRLFELAIGFQKPGCVLMVDIDHFKAVNDQYGHQAGDQVLIGVARVLERCLRATDVIGRIGGEEFVCVVEGDEFIGNLLAERIRSELEKTSLRAGAVRIRVTASIGFTEYSANGTGAAFEAALGVADKALYVAKSNGRNRVMIGN